MGGGASKKDSKRTSSTSSKDSAPPTKTDVERYTPMAELEDDEMIIPEPREPRKVVSRSKSKEEVSLITYMHPCQLP